MKGGEFRGNVSDY